jgi:hypothetical protein
MDLASQRVSSRIYRESAWKGASPTFVTEMHVHHFVTMQYERSIFTLNSKDGTDENADQPGILFYIVYRRI